jgi:dUTP pyrophosphatase
MISGLSVKIYRKDKNAELPVYTTKGAAGADLSAFIPQEITLKPGERKKISTGLAMEIPAGWEAQVRPRSGLALEHGITVLNAPGTIDSDYRGELGIILVNLGAEPFTIHNGDRIAQLVFAPAPQIPLETVPFGSPWPVETASQTAPVVQTAEKIDGSERGEGGFGSTGIKNNAHINTVTVKYDEA